MTRYIENLNECTDPTSGDYLWIVDASAGSTDKDRKANAAKFAIVGAANTFTAAQVITSASAAGTYLRLNNTTSNAANRNWLIGLNQVAYGDLHIMTGTTEGGAPSSTRISISALGYVGIPTLAGSGNRAVYSDPDGYLTNSSSDATLKRDIVPIDAPEALAIVAALQPVRYNWIDGERRGEQREIGLLAQEVAPHVPEVVGVNADGTLSLDYPKLTALLIGAVQELTARVAALEAAAEPVE